MSDDYPLVANLGATASQERAPFDFAQGRAAPRFLSQLRPTRRFYASGCASAVEHDQFLTATLLDLVLRAPRQPLFSPAPAGPDPGSGWRLESWAVPPGG